jgi:hypothetical protein
MTTFFHLYLKKDFPELWKKDDDVKLEVLLSYINSRKDIGSREVPQKASKINKMNQSHGKFHELSFGDKAEEKERMFNRSVDYFKE